MADFNFSVFTAGSAADAGDDRLIDVLRREIDPEKGSPRWRTSRGGPWFHLFPVGGKIREQGWKLHVSATVASAEEVLARSLPVLLAAGSAFKFAASIDQVAALNARNASRGHSGKFITVYPDGDDEAVRLAAELHRLTAGLPGPRILSDRPYSPDSLVHYRYGAFVEDRRLTHDGFYAWMILDPDGNPVEDRRTGKYTPPPWVTSPFPPYDQVTQENPASPGKNGGKSTVSGARGDRKVIGAGAGGAGGNGGRGGILIGGRFAVREAIRHVNKGGVYRAVDTRTGEPVVIKEARPHVAADAQGRDCRDGLRTEARVLGAIAHLGLAARPVELFTQNGHLFLAEELVPGVALRQWVPDLIDRTGWGAHLPPALEMARRLLDLVAGAHGAGLLLRDFNPNNVMVRPEGRPVLIDLELALTADDPHRRPVHAGTPAFGAPEQLTGAPEPDVTADLYSLGATLCYVLTGAPPYFLDERPHARPATARLEEWLTSRVAGLDLAAPLIPALLGLMDEVPERRWSLERVRDVLAPSASAPASAPAPAASGGVGTAPESLDELCDEAIAGVAGHLLDTMNPDAPERLWPGSCVHGAPDPCCLQHGAAGPLGVLVRYFEVTGDPAMPEAIARGARWMLRRLDGDGKRPPGLYFGTAGAVWAVLSAGLALDDADLVRGAVAAADRLPVAAESHDITHGTAGLGLTALYLHARTGHARFAERAAAAAAALAGSVRERPDGGLDWSTPAKLESKLAGTSYYGFAHGIAGAGYFLLAAAQAGGDAGHRALAARVGDTLLDAAVVTRGTAMWPTGSGAEPTAPYWCHGAAGIGAFLAPLGAATGDARVAEVADLAAAAVVEHSWRAVLGQCHGLAGNGEFLLDMAAGAATPADAARYRTAARRFARLVLANRAYRDGRVLFPDEQGDTTTTWGDGMTGILSFLLRLRHGTSRLWTAGQAAGQTPPAESTAAGSAVPLTSGSGA